MASNVAKLKNIKNVKEEVKKIQWRLCQKV